MQDILRDVTLTTFEIVSFKLLFGVIPDENIWKRFFIIIFKAHNFLSQTWDFFHPKKFIDVS